MSMFRVTPSQLKSQATQLRTDNANFQKLIQSLSEKEQLLSSQWEGEANTAFHNAFLNDFQQFQNFHSGIEKFIEALENDATNYEKAEQQNTNTARTRTS